MESIIVEGGRPLEGKVSISGAKNSVLPLLWRLPYCSGAAVCYITAPGYPMWQRRQKFWSIWVAGWTAPGTAFG